MTGETEDKTKPWVEKHGMKYAYGYLSKDGMGEFMKALGMRGYPSAVLVDPTGEIVWSGHPSSANGGLIKKHIKGANKGPVGVAGVVANWPKEAQHAKKAFLAGKYGKAVAEARKLPQEWSVLGDIERVIARRVDRVKAIFAKGDYLGFEDAMRTASKELAGTEALDELDGLVAEMKADPKSKSVISGQKRLAKYAESVADARKAKELLSLEKKIRKLSEKHAGTYVEACATKLLAKSEEKRDALSKSRR